MTQILIIDDDRTIRILLERTLTQNGYDTICASHGEEGLSQARQLRPALIICDWLMPGIDGLEVCRQVKGIAELSTTFFILLTSLGSVEDRVKGLDAGADDFLCKPIEMNELIARVRAGLRLHQLSQDLTEQKQLLEAELVEAAEYVCSILPEPIRLPFLQIDACFIPSRQLGGDSFDYFWLDENHLVIYLLDVSGHGLRAALPSLSVINLLRSRGLNQVNYYQPSDILKRLNQTFQMTQRNDKYFTIWYGVYNPKTRQLVYASAGHPPAILLSQKNTGSFFENHLKTAGFPIGMFLEAEYADARVLVSPHSSLYIFSDGIYEIEGDEGTILGLAPFLVILKKYQANQQRTLDRLLWQIKTWNAGKRFDDDLSIVQVDFF